MYSRYLKLILQIALILSCIELFSVMYRIFLEAITPPLILKMHEYIKCLSSQSVLVMIESPWPVLVDIGIESKSNLATH